jgi:hypothetical protein
VRFYPADQGSDRKYAIFTGSFQEWDKNISPWSGWRWEEQPITGAASSAYQIG